MFLRRGIRCIFFSAALTVVLPTPQTAHTGNAWHGSWNTIEPALAIKGLNTAYLTLGGPGMTSTFHVRYPKDRSDKTIFINANRLFVAVVPDAAWAKGYATKLDLVSFATTQIRGQDLNLDFHIPASGVYHFVFGPWDGDVLVLSVDPQYEPFDLTARDGAVRWIARIGGDASVAGGPAKVAGSADRELLFWISFVTPAALNTYNSLGIFRSAYPLSDSLKATLAQRLLAMGVFSANTPAPAQR